MNIEKIKYFIDLVECRNFTDTARKNYVSQTTISQQIASLEKEFSIQLINRNHIPIEPTQAGWIFYGEAQILWKQYIQMQHKMENYLQGGNRTLMIEYAAITDITSLLKIIPGFREEYANTRIELNKVLLKDIASHLEKGVYDLAIAFDSEFTDNPNVRTKSLSKGTYCALVPKGHPLYQNQAITMKELYKHPLVMLNPASIGNSYHLMLKRAMEEGFLPEIRRTVDDVETELFYIVSEQLIGFFPDKYPVPYMESDVRLIPLQDTAHKYEIVAAYLKDNTNMVLKEFLQRLSD